MPPKAKPDVSKKTVQKQKQKIIEDKTFGLKNKNKSKKVQQQIKSIEKNVMNSGDPKMRRLEEQRRQAKDEAKARKKAMKDEQDALFGAALLAVQKKSASTANQKEAKIEAKGRDANDDANKKATSRAMKMMFQMDAQEMDEKLREDPNYIPTLEDEVEAQRQKKVADLKASGIAGTPVTAETFAAWKERKQKAKQEAVRKKLEAEFRKKKGGKGLSVLSGRDLYEYKKELFNKEDDDEGPSDNEEMEDTTPTIQENGTTTEENGDDTNNNGDTNNDKNLSNGEEVNALVNGVKQELFLHEDDEDLDDLEDDEDE